MDKVQLGDRCKAHLQAYALKMDLKKPEEAKSDGIKPDEGINPAQDAETIAKRS